MAEREKARQVIDKLAREYEDRAEIKRLLWEDLPLRAIGSFQQGIDLVLSTNCQIDVAVFILWSRLGTPVGPDVLKVDGTPYLSGTEREFDLMLEASKKTGGKRPW